MAIIMTIISTIISTIIFTIISVGITFFKNSDPRIINQFFLAIILSIVYNVIYITKDNNKKESVK